jgi:hypothetical protein
MDDIISVLSNEILLQIAESIPAARDLFNFRVVCQAFNLIADDVSSTLWRQYYADRFSITLRELEGHAEIKDWKERYKTRIIKENSLVTLSEPIPDTRPRTVELLKRVVHIHNKNRELQSLIAPTPEPEPEPEPTPVVAEEVQPTIPVENPEEAEANPEPENPPPLGGGFQVDADGGLFFGDVKTEDDTLYSQPPLDQLRSCLRDLYSQINNFKLLLRMSHIQETEDEDGAPKTVEVHPFVEVGAFDLIMSLLNKYVDDVQTLEHVLNCADYLVRTMASSMEVLGIVNPLLHAIVVHTQPNIRNRATHLLWYLMKQVYVRRLFCELGGIPQFAKLIKTPESDDNPRSLHINCIATLTWVYSENSDADLQAADLVPQMIENLRVDDGTRLAEVSAKLLYSLAKFDAARIVKLGGVEVLATLTLHKSEAIASSAVDTLLSLSWEEAGAAYLAETSTMESIITLLRKNAEPGDHQSLLVVDKCLRLLYNLMCHSELQMMKYLDLGGLKILFEILPHCLQTAEGPKTLVLSYLNMMSGSINGAMEMGQTEELLPMLKANLEKFAEMIDHPDLRVQQRVIDFFLSVTCVTAPEGTSAETIISKLLNKLKSPDSEKYLRLNSANVLANLAETDSQLFAFCDLKDLTDFLTDALTAADVKKEEETWSLSLIGYLLNLEAVRDLLIVKSKALDVLYECTKQPLAADVRFRAVLAFSYLNLTGKLDTKYLAALEDFATSVFFNIKWGFVFPFLDAYRHLFNSDKEEVCLFAAWFMAHISTNEPGKKSAKSLDPSVIARFEKMQHSKIQFFMQQFQRNMSAKHGPLFGFFHAH